MDAVGDERWDGPEGLRPVAAPSGAYALVGHEQDELLIEIVEEKGAIGVGEKASQDGARGAGRLIAMRRLGAGHRVSGAAQRTPSSMRPNALVDSRTAALPAAVSATSFRARPPRVDTGPDNEVSR